MQDISHAMREGLIKIPYFRDAHMHFTKNGKPVSKDVISGIGRDCAKYGVFEVDDMGHKSGVGLQARGILSAVVKVRSSGWAIFREGTYGVFIGKGNG